MECVLKADIFDFELADKMQEAMSLELIELEKEQSYGLVISFHVDLLKDSRMNLVDVPLEKWKRNDSKEDKIYNLLNYQLNKIDKALCDKGMKIIDASIQGEQLEALDIVKFQIKKETEISTFRKKKSSKPIKVRTVVPSLPSSQEKASKLASERLSKIYNDLIWAIRDKKIMSEILEIEATEDNNVLFKAFCEQYWQLWLCPEDQRKAIVNKLMERVEIVFTNIKR